MKLAVAAVALAACSDPPPLTVQYSLASTSQVCQADKGGNAESCSDIGLPCDSYLSLRIVDPAEPTHAYLSVCQPITGRKDLCSIAGINLPAAELPAQTLQIQVAIYPTSELTDSDGDGFPDCPAGPSYSDDGLVNVPLGGAPMPAVGGAAFYTVGAAKTLVPLGCPSQQHLDACLGIDTVAITATAIDFDTDLAASNVLADKLQLFVGEPQSMDGTTFVLDPGETTALTRTQSPIPSWEADDMQTFQQLACIELLDFEPAAQITPVLTCQHASASSTALDFQAVRIAPSTLSQALMALTGEPGVPVSGITMGVVLDDTGAPVAGATVTTSTSDPVYYLNSDRIGVTMNTKTTGNGVFFVTGAKLGTTFSSARAPDSIGGNVEGKVTAVILQYQMPMGN